MKNRTVSLLVAAMVTMAACSSGEESSSSNGEPESSPVDVALDSAASDGSTVTATAVDGNAGGPDLAENRGVVVIGSDRYEFTMAGSGTLCLTLTGATSFGAGALVDGDGNEIKLAEGGRAATLSYYVYDDDVEPGDEPPNITVRDDENDRRWMAGIEVEGTQISGVTIDGVVTRGSATFVDDVVRQSGGVSEPVAGTFEIACAG